MMQIIWIVVWIICIASLSNPLIAFSLALSDTTLADSLKSVEPDFRNVNVLVETEWGMTDKRDGVDVYVKMKGKEPVEIEMIKGEYQKCTFVLMPGLTVKIFDPQSGRMLKKY